MTSHTVTDTSYFLGFDEETIYLLRAAYPTPEEAREEFLRLSIEELGMANDEVEDIRAVAATVPMHESEESRCYHGECECPAVDVWEFAP